VVPLFEIPPIFYAKTAQTHDYTRKGSDAAVSEDKVRAAFYAEKALLKSADICLAKADCRSRNEFINKAIRHYIAYLQKEDDNEFLTPALESVLSGMLGDSENRIARLLFKLAVETSMLLHVTASQCEITIDEIDRLKKFCAEEVSRLNGRVTFENAYRHQKG
jgi:metal-responsive CopG/Arc/MetJ family transcriptional regulator